MPLIELELERDGLLEMDLLGNFIGSAYAPQVDVTETDTGHEVAITYDDAATGITTKTFDVEDGAQGPQGPAGFSPTVTITDTPTGHTVTITDEDGPHSYDVPNYVQEEQQRQTAWDALSGEVTDAISDAETATSAASTAAQSATSAATSATSAAQAATTAAASANSAASAATSAATAANSAATAAGTAADAATTAAGDATDAAQAANTAAEAAQEAATEVAPEVAWLWGNQLTKDLSGELMQASDAYGAPMLSLGVDGKSTQDGTPTPDAPVPIESVDSVELHASADGTTDYGNWPVTLYDGTLRSLPDGTRDTLALLYLRPSTREGWAWYSRELVQATSEETFDGSETWNLGSTGFPGTTKIQSSVKKPPSNTTGIHMFCTMGMWYSNKNMQTNHGVSVAQTGKFYVNFDGITTVEQLISLLQDTPMHLVYPLGTPITTQLAPVELPVLPAPNCTVWADPTTGLQMEYVQDTNIVIASLQAALADLATS